MSVTVDVNVLLYASDVASPRHERARQVVERIAAGPDLAYLFWPTIMAYLRIATHPAIFDRPLALGDATGNIEALISRPHVLTPGEQDAFWTTYRSVVDDASPTGNLVPDAHLVALMRQHDVGTIWTHDRDFRRFGAINVSDPFA